MQQCDRLFHYPAMNAQAGAVFDTTSRNVGGDAFGADLVAVDVVVVGPVGVEAVGASPWATSSAAYRWYCLDQWEELGDVVTVAARSG